ncbi:hypothetical protein WDW86_22515 [Bdellovibrionota bacterium FG-2]
MEFISPELHEFSAGTKLRLIERNYVHAAFSLFEAVTEDPRTLLPSKNQRAIFVDPYFGWHSESMPWVGLSITNVGVATPRDTLYPEKKDLGIGVGVRPPLAFGILRVGIDAVNLFTAEDFLSRFRLGASYKFGIMELIAGANSNSGTGGLQYSLQVFQVGIVYEFMRGDLSGGEPENRIATEFAIRL